MLFFATPFIKIQINKVTINIIKKIKKNEIYNGFLFYYAELILQAHIGDILRSKFGNFKNFHTLLYTCAPEFDFLEYETYTKLTKTCLIPAMLLSVAIIVFTVSYYIVTFYSYFETLCKNLHVRNFSQMILYTYVALLGQKYFYEVVHVFEAIPQINCVNINSIIC